MSNVVSKRRRAKGVAAVELAIWLPLLVLLLGAGLFLGRLFWHYTVAQKAAHDAVIFLSQANVREMRMPPAGGSTETPIAALTRKIAQEELAELRPGGPYPISITVLCDGATCDGLTVPSRVTVWIRMAVFDDFFPDITAQFGGSDSIILQANVTAKFVGS
jgi:hypothetical protein